jgi:IS1 family transposase
MVSMNGLSADRRAQVVRCLVEGMSIRGTVRITGVAKNTVVKLLADLGAECSAYQDASFRDLTCKRIEVDEIWSFVYAKDKNLPQERVESGDGGSVWTWVAIDADTKLVPSWLVGQRDTEDCRKFMFDLCSRINGRIQLTSDGWKAYRPAVANAFGDEIDFAMLHKIYGQEGSSPEKRYSPAVCTGVDVKVISGDPDVKKISTSYVERQNLTMRMNLRRFTRLTNAFSKKIENHAAEISLHFMHYNFRRVHTTLTKKHGQPTTPAMAAGLAEEPWTIDDLVSLLPN